MADGTIMLSDGEDEEEIRISNDNGSSSVTIKKENPLEWSEEYGDIAPRHEALEKMLFRDKMLFDDENKMEKGEQFKWGAARKHSFLGRQCGQVRMVGGVWGCRSSSRSSRKDAL